RTETKLEHTHGECPGPERPGTGRSPTPRERPGPRRVRSGAACPHACRERAPRPFAARSPENTTTRGRLECRILAPRVAGIAPPWTTALTAGPNSGRQSRIRRPALPPPAP